MCVNTLAQSMLPGPPERFVLPSLVQLGSILMNSPFVWMVEYEEGWRKDCRQWYEYPEPIRCQLEEALMTNHPAPIVIKYPGWEDIYEVNIQLMYVRNRRTTMERPLRRVQVVMDRSMMLNPPVLNIAPAFEGGKKRRSSL